MKNSLVIAKYTYIEVYRSKIMIGLLFLSFAVLVVTYIASEFAYGAPEKVALDFGFGVMSISNLLVAIFLGSTLLSKEIETKTLYMIISRPLSRSSFLIGKILGLSSILILNTLFLSMVSVGLYLFLGGSFTNLLVWVGIYSLLESFIIMFIAILFSLISNVTMSIMLTMFILIAGHTIGDSQKIFFSKNNIVISKILSAGSYIVPNFERLNIKDFVLYKQSLETSFLLSSMFYALLLITAGICLISYVFNRKNLD